MLLMTDCKFGGRWLRRISRRLHTGMLVLLVDHLLFIASWVNVRSIRNWLASRSISSIMAKWSVVNCCTYIYEFRIGIRIINTFWWLHCSGFCLTQVFLLRLTSHSYSLLLLFVWTKGKSLWLPYPVSLSTWCTWSLGLSYINLVLYLWWCPGCTSLVYMNLRIVERLVTCVLFAPLN